MATSLENHRIKAIPYCAMYYVPNFITPQEEEHILTSLPERRWISLSKRRLQAHPSVLSKSDTLLEQPLPAYLRDPILQRFSRLRLGDGGSDGDGGKTGLFAHSPHGAPNHVLVNEYLSGQGIMPHEDGGAYWPCVATLSLGSSCVLDVCDKPSSSSRPASAPRLSSATSASSDATTEQTAQRHYRIFQERRSLLVTVRDAYTDTLHGIAPVDVDERLSAETVANWDLLGEKPADGTAARGTRISLTYRDVLKVSSAGSRILGRRK